MKAHPLFRIGLILTALLSLILQRSPLVQAAAAPVYQWHSFFGARDKAAAMAVDSAGNTYLAGMADVTWGTPFNAHRLGTDIVVLKLDSSGHYLWHTFFGSDSPDRATGIALDGAGNVYISGTSGAAWNGPGDAAPLNAHSGGDDLVVVKLSPSGAYVWHTFYGGAGDDQGLTMVADNSGLYVTGNSNATWGSPLNAHTGLHDVVVVKLAFNGDYAWHTFYGGSKVDTADGIDLDGSGGLYLVGKSEAAWDGPGGAAPRNPYAGGGRDMLILKLTTAGAYAWHTFYGATTDRDTAYEVATGSAGDVYITGFSWAGWNGPGDVAPLNPYSGGVDIVVMKLSPTGSYRWHSFFGSALADAIKGDNGGAITVDSADNLYVVGHSSDTWGDPVSPHSGMWDITLMKLTSGGDLQWLAFYGAAQDDWGEDIVLQGSNLFVSGFSNAAWGSAGAPGVPVNPFTSRQNMVAMRFKVDTTTPTPTFTPTPTRTPTPTPTVTLTPQPALTSTQVQASALQVIPGQPVTLTATVTSAAGTPTGNVTFRAGNSVIGTTALVNGAASITVSNLSLGSHVITAQYAGNASFAASTGTLAGGVQVVKAQASILMTTDPIAPLSGAPITFNVTVSPVAPAAGVPTGTVTLLDNGSSLGTLLLENGSAALTISGLTAGNHTVTATYSGDPGFNSATLEFSVIVAEPAVQNSLFLPLMTR